MTTKPKRRVAIDQFGLPYPVIVENGLVWDAAIWPFNIIRGPGTPVDKITFRRNQ